VSTSPRRSGDAADLLAFGRIEALAVAKPSPGRSDSRLRRVHFGPVADFEINRFPKYCKRRLGSEPDNVAPRGGGFEAVRHLADDPADDDAIGEH
jgi:hypothetical protein